MGRRKDRNRIRTASGRPSRSKVAQKAEVQTTMAVALAQPHRRWLPKADRGDQLAESETGRLYLAGLITLAELGAAQTYASLTTAYRAVISAPGTGTSVLGQLVGDAFAKCEVAREDDEVRKQRIFAQYDHAQALLRGLQSGSLILAIVGRVAVHGMAPGADLPSLRKGLMALAEAWKLAEPATSGGKRRVPIKSWTAPSNVEPRLDVN